MWPTAQWPGVCRGALAQSACADRLEALPVHWLTEAARLLPELGVLCPGLPPPPPLDAPGGQSRFYEGLRQVLSAICQGATPNVLFFDDMHWADTASLDLLAYLVRRLAGQPLFILATWRSDEAPAVSRLRALVAEAQRAGLGTALMLKRLALADVLDIVRDLSAAGVNLPDDISGRLYHETEGLPLFLAAYLEALAQSEAKGAGETWPVPRGVANLLQARLDAVEETARQALQAASVIGRSFDLGTLQATSGRSDEEIVFALEELASRGIITEVAEEAGAPPRYDFTHEKLRALVYEETSLVRRRLLHGRAARSLLERARFRHDRDTQSGQIGRHFRLAGQDADAAACFVLAGDHAHSLYANAEALAHYQDALALGHGGARAAYTRRSATCTRSWAPTPRRSAVTKPLRRCANHQTQPWPRSSTSWGRSTLAAASGQPPRRTSRPRWTLPAPRLQRATTARILADWSLAAHAQGRSEQASTLAFDALAAAESARDPLGTAQTHNILGILARSRGDSTGAASHLERGLAIAETLPDPSSRIAALNNLALAHADSGDLAQATALAEQALALGAALGDRHREAALRNNLADLLHAAGRGEEAMTQLKLAVIIFAEIGGKAGDTQPEIWKLTEW